MNSDLTIHQTDVLSTISYRVFPEAMDASIAAAHEIADLIRQRDTENKTCVLGLATGSTSEILMLFITPKVFNIKARGRAAQPRVACHHQIADPNPNGVQQKARQ